MDLSHNQKTIVTGPNNLYFTNVGKCALRIYAYSRYLDFQTWTSEGWKSVMSFPNSSDISDETKVKDVILDVIVKFSHTEFFAALAAQS